MRKTFAVPLALVACLAAAPLVAQEEQEDPAETPLAAEDERLEKFATLDMDGDSYLDDDEVAEWVDDVGLLNRWDIDDDSELDADEIDGNVFAVWDADGNGSISETEWKTGADLWFPADFDYVTLADWDADGDSELDADEFAESFDSSTLGEAWSDETLGRETFGTAFFQLWDIDDDGRISKSEFERGKDLYQPTS